jgi:hypothetical protein
LGNTDGDQGVRRIAWYYPRLKPEVRVTGHRVRMVGPKSLCIVFFVFVVLGGCDLVPTRTAIIEVENRDPDGWSMNVTVNGITKIILAFSSELWGIEWRRDSFYEVTMQATYTTHGGSLSRSTLLQDGSSFVWIIYVCPGFYW